MPLGDAARAGADGQAESKPATPAVAEPVPDEAPAAPPVEASAPAPTVRAQPPPPPRKPARSASGSPSGRSGWVVQLGSFSNPRNAYALRDRLKAKGYGAFAVTSKTGTEAVTRVYVGPEPERAGAQRHVGKLLEETRLKGIVVRYPKPGT